MTGLFARLYFDEDVSVRVADTLKARGFDVVTTLQAGRLGATDSGQLHFAVAEGRALVTHNRRHFERLVSEYFRVGLQHSGLIIAVRRPPRELAACLLGALNRFSSEEFLNQSVYV